MSLEAQAQTPLTPRYARFTRRLRGMVIDWILAMVLLFGAAGGELAA
jgi:hypothetical protein